MSSNDLTPRKQAGKAAGTTESEHSTARREAALAMEGSFAGSRKASVKERQP